MIRFLDGPHKSNDIPLPFASGWYQYVFPDCGCVYSGYTSKGNVLLHYLGKRTSDVGVPEAFVKAFAPQAEGA